MKKCRLNKEDINFLYECITGNNFNEENITVAPYEVVEKYIKKYSVYSESADPSVLEKLRHLLITWLRNTLPIISKINSTYQHHIATNESLIYSIENNKLAKLRKLQMQQKKLARIQLNINKQIADLKMTPTPKLQSKIRTVLTLVSTFVQLSYLPRGMKIMYRIGVSIILGFLTNTIIKGFIYIYPFLKRFTDKLKAYLGIEKKKPTPIDLKQFDASVANDVNKMKSIKEKITK